MHPRFSDWLQSVRHPQAWWRSVNTEPVIFIFSVQLGLFVSGFPPLLYYKVCANLYGAEHDDIGAYCKSLTLANAVRVDAQDEVEQGVSMFSQYLYVCNSVPMIFVSLIMGSIIDSHGRKGPLVFSLVATCVTSLMQLASTVVIRSSRLWLLVPALLSGLTGQVTVTMIACFSSIADLEYDANKLTTRLGIGAAMVTSGVVVGSLLEGWVVIKWGFGYVMLLIQLFLVLATLYAMFCVRETVQLAKTQFSVEDELPRGSSVGSGDPVGTDVATTASPRAEHVTGTLTVPSRKEKTKMFLRQACSLNRCTDSLRTIFTPRADTKRAYLLFMLASYFLVSFSDIGSPLYLYLKRTPLNWHARLYGFYIAYVSALSAIGSAGVAWIFKKVFRTSDLLMLAIGLFFIIVQKVLFCASLHTWMVFMAGAFVLIAAINNPGYRSSFALLVEREERGKIFSVLGLLDNIAPLLSTLVYNNVYTGTVDWRPRFVFILSACVVTVGLSFIMYA